ncbi:MAG: hypothetical protein ACLTNO_01000 [Blautia sp.]
MINENDLRTIITQVLSEMNLDNKEDKAVESDHSERTQDTVAGGASTLKTPKVEDGCIPDITQVDIKKQYLVKDPVNGEAYYDLKQYAPCRLGIGKAGARYKTDPMLSFARPTRQHRMQSSLTWIRSSSIKWDFSQCRLSVRTKTSI